jgi:hypothetical protein
MIERFRKWLSHCDSLTRNQLFLVAMAAAGFLDYFNYVLICALEIPIALLTALVCFGRSRRTIWRYLVELMRQSALLCALLLIIFIALQRNDRGLVSDLPWRNLIEPLLVGTIYYALQFVTPLRGAFYAENPSLQWYRTVLIPLFPVFFVLLVAAFCALALHFILHAAPDSAIFRVAATALMALTALARIGFTRVLANAQIESFYIEFLSVDASNRER